MTLNGSTLCNIIQSFPVLLILAQKNNKCLKTPFIYKPPSPTHSPEYYEAYDALIQSLFGHDCDHSYPQYDHNAYGYGKKWSTDYTYYKPCSDHYPTAHAHPTLPHGHDYSHGPSHYYPHGSSHYFPQGSTYGYAVSGYPYYGSKKANLNATYVYKYAPNQMRNTKNKYKIVVLNNGRRRKVSEKLQQGFFPQREERRQFGFMPNFFPNPRRITESLSGILHFRPGQDRNQQYVYPFNNIPGITNSRPNNRPNYPNDFDQGRNSVRFPDRTQDIPYDNVNFERPNNPNIGPERPNENSGFNGNTDNNGGFVAVNNENGGLTSGSNNNGPVFGTNDNDDQGSGIIENNGPGFGSNNGGLVTGSNDNGPVFGNNENSGLISGSNDGPAFGNNENGGLISGTNDGPAFGNNENGGLISGTNDGPAFGNNENGGLISGTNAEPEFSNNGGLISGNNDGRPVFASTDRTEAPFPVTNVPHFADRNGENAEGTTTTLPPLTPVPAAEVKNNLNFGSQGIFRETCDTVDGGVGTCISIKSCAPYVKLLQSQSSEVVRVLRSAHCGFEGNDPKVCCPLPGVPTAAPAPGPQPTPAPVPTVTPRTSIGDFLPALLDPPVCGFSNATFSRVIGGIKAKLGDFPWMALLGYKKQSDTRWLCGGSLISSRHVLTAAHCIHNHETDLYVVRLGELDLAREDEGATPIDVLIKSKTKHEGYDSKAFTNDIGILLLERDVQFTGLIRPICIPKEAELRARSFEDFNPMIAGWGDTEFRGPSASHLQVLQLPVVSNEYCAQAYSQYKAQVIDGRVLCAGFKRGGKDACQGDSGGPLMQPIWNSEAYTTFFYQIGVVSFGKRCAEAGFPGVYTRVTEFVPWIQKLVVGTA